VGTWADPTRDAEPIAVSKHLGALRRGWPLIGAIVLSMTGAVLLLSALVPKTYEAEARIFMDDRAGASEPADVETVQRRLATVRELVTTRRVLAGAAAVLEGETTETLRDKVAASVDRDANVVDMSATDGAAEGAAAIANAVARSFLALDLAAQRARLARARTSLLRAISLARGAEERRVLRERLSELSITGASAGSELSLAEPARAPDAASSPRPLRNGLFAFFGALFLGVLAALALDQLAPRVRDGRELSRLTGAPLLARVTSRRRRGGRGLATAAHEQLRSSLAVQLPHGVKTVAVTGDLPGPGRSAVATAMARTLAELDASVLLVSADLRKPRALELLGAPRAPGLVDVLEALRSGNGRRPALRLEDTIVRGTPQAPELDVLPAGTATDRPSPLLAGNGLAELFAQLEQSDYRYVVVEAPPLLGTVDGALVARHADAVLVACHLDHLAPDDAVELGDVLRRLDVQVVGLVTIDARPVARQPSVAPWPLPPRERVEA
jgi:Mrp family chromosome partitioning ATPase